jgi:hypothetical protein
MSEVGIQTELIAIRRLLGEIVSMMAQRSPLDVPTVPPMTFTHTDDAVYVSAPVKRKPGRPARKK